MLQAPENSASSGVVIAKHTIRRLDVCAGCEALAGTLSAMAHLRQLSLSHAQLTDAALAVLLTPLKVSACFDTAFEFFHSVSGVSLCLTSWQASAAVIHS